MKRITKKALILSLNLAGRPNREIAMAVETHPSYVANILKAERQRAERQGGFDRPSAFDQFDQGGE